MYFLKDLCNPSAKEGWHPRCHLEFWDLEDAGRDMSISPSLLKDLILKKNKRVKTLMCSIFWSLLFLFNRCWWVFFGWGTCSPMLHCDSWMFSSQNRFFFATPVPWHFLSAVPSLGFWKQPHGKSISNTMAYSCSWVSKWVFSWKLKKWYSISCLRHLPVRRIRQVCHGKSMLSILGCCSKKINHACNIMYYYHNTQKKI